MGATTEGTAEGVGSEIDASVYARRWHTLGVLCLSLTIVMVGNVSLNLALPAIARELDASSSALQWMVDSYALVFAGLLFAAGTIGDRFGRKGALQAGLVLFVVAAVAGSVAGSPAAVIAARAVMGVAAAFVMPSTLSILTTVFPASERGRAISVWVGVAAGGAALGPIGTGLLLQHFWWGSVFLMSVPLAVAALVAGRWWVPTSRDPDEHPIDVIGSALSIAGVGALVYAIIEAPHHGWASAPTGLAFGAAAVALALFALREATARDPMLDLRLFRDRRFSVASGGIALTYLALFGTFFLVAQYVQLVMGESPIVSGLVVLPQPVTMLLVAPRVPRLVERFGPRRVVPLGLGSMALGLVGLSLLDASSPTWTVSVALVPLAVGVASTGAPLTTLVMAAVPPERAGVGSAMNDTSREVGGALGVAVLGSLVTTQFSGAVGSELGALGSLPAGARAQVESGLSGALEVAGRLTGAGGDGQALAEAARDAWVDGFALAVLAAAGVLLAAAVAVRTLLPRGAWGRAAGPAPTQASTPAPAAPGARADLAGDPAAPAPVAAPALAASAGDPTGDPASPTPATRTPAAAPSATAAAGADPAAPPVGPPPAPGDAGAVGPTTAGPGPAGPGAAGPGPAGPGAAGPGAAGPGAAGPGAAGPGPAGGPLPPAA
ncbi:MAG TPA: MFS transporter [Acidimicrobiales bacterium]